MRERKFNKMRELSFDSEKFETKTLGGRIRYWRLSSGMKQEDLAEKMDLSKQTISNYENNNTDVDASKLVDLADILGIEVGWLFADQFFRKVEELENKVNGSISSEEIVSIYEHLSEDIQILAFEQMRLLLSFYERKKDKKVD